MLLLIMYVVLEDTSSSCSGVGIGTGVDVDSGVGVVVVGSTVSAGGTTGIEVTSAAAPDVKISFSDDFLSVVIKQSNHPK